MYKPKDVCAVIVSYNDADALCKNLASIRNQVDRVLVIDNASDSACVDVIKTIEDNSHVFVNYDVENKGIAYQLNKGLNYCLKNGYRLMLSMDQDSSLYDNCISEMLTVLNGNDKSVVSVGPNREYPRWIENGCFREKKYLITSGNLLIVDKAIECGGFFDELFIDMVDVDFSLALRAKGYRVGVSTKARMNHRVGITEKRKWLIWEYEYLSHTPSRFYYIYRNRQIVCRKYFKRFPVYCVKMWFVLMLQSVSILLEKDSFEKLRNAWQGTIDGMKFDFVSFN